jgi:hypothetical protein
MDNNYKKPEKNKLIQEIVQLHREVEHKCLNYSNQYSNFNRDDLRIRYFQDVHRFTIVYSLCFELSTFMENSKRIESMKRIAVSNESNSIIIPKYILELRNDFLNEIKTGLFLRFCFEFEWCISSIWEAVKNKTCNTNSKIEVLCKELNDDRIISDEAFNLFRILIYSRNLIHNVGIQRKKTAKINYKDRTFDFIEGMVVRHFDIGDVFFLFNEVIDAFFEIFSNAEIKKINFIPYPTIV